MFNVCRQRHYYRLTAHSLQRSIMGGPGNELLQREEYKWENHI
jgi:hypothetical protein